MDFFKVILVFWVALYIVACHPTEYTEVRFQEFPEAYKQYDRYPWEMFELEEFSAAYLEILDDFPDDQYPDEFIYDLFVVSSGNRFVTTTQGAFVFMAGCKPHYCDVSRIFVLYDPEDKRAWAYAYDLGVIGEFEV